MNMIKSVYKRCRVSSSQYITFRITYVGKDKKFLIEKEFENYDTAYEYCVINNSFYVMFRNRILIEPI